MAAPTTAEEALLAAALAPKEVSKNGHTVIQHNLGDLLEVANRESASDATSQPHMGLRFTRLIPGPRT